MDEKKDWKRFKKLKFDSKTFSKRAKKAETVTTKHAHKFVLKKLSNLRRVRQYISLWFLLVAGLLGALILQIVWFQSSYTATDRVAGGTYAEAVEGGVNTLNPLYVQTEAEESVRQLLFSGLLGRDEAGRPRNDLASGFTIDPTGKVYTVTLRDNLHWSDGANLTAHDVVFTVEAMKNPAARAVMNGSWQGVTARAVNDKTVEFVLPAPYSSFVDALTFSILPKHILGDVDPVALRENAFSVSPVGSGPFAFRLLQKTSDNDGTHKIVHMIANRQYYRAPVKLERFELHAYTSPDAMLRAAKSHDVNAIADSRRSVSFNELPADFIRRSIPVNNATYAFFNNNSEILKDAKIRSVLWTGTNVDALRKSVDVDARSMNLPILSSQVAINGIVAPNTKGDVVAAKKQLDELGWKVAKDSTRIKDGKQLTIKVVANKTGNYEPLLHELKKQWQLLGIKVDVIEFEQQAGGQGFAQSVLQIRDYDVLINEIAIGSDPDVFAYWHSSQATANGLNFSNYKSGKVDDILTSARQSNVQQLRQEKYRAFARQWVADAPAIPLFQPVLHYAHTKRTSSLSDTTRSLPSPSARYSAIDYWTAERGTVYKTP